MSHKNDKTKLTDAQRTLMTQYLAEFEGKITVAWHRFMDETGNDFGDSTEENPFFMCFYAGASEGSSINTDAWMEYLGINNEE